MEDNANPKKKHKTLLFLTLILALILILTTVNFFFFEKDAVFEPNDSYWAGEQPKPNAPLTKDIDVDIAIIGGGYTGLSSAWHLAKANPDKKIILLEARLVGNGGSGRNGGMILPHLGPELDDILDDGKIQKRVYDITAANMKKIQELVDTSGIDCDLKLNGYVYAIFQKDKVEIKRQYVKKCNGIGIPLEFWDKEKTKKELGTERYEAAIYDPNGGSVHAMKLVKALKKLSEDAGVTIYENSPVISIEEGEPVKLTVGEHKYIVNAKSIVLATNAFTTKLGYLKRKIAPLHVQVAATRPLTPKEIQALKWNSRLPFYDSRTMLFHLVLTPDNRIVIGGGNADYFFNKGLEYKDDMNVAAAIMLNELKQLYPELDDITLDYSWNGIIGITLDGSTAYGITGKNNNIYYAVAHNGHGVNSSIMYGDIIAHLYSKQKHPWIELYSGNKLVMIPDPFLYIGFSAFKKIIQWDDKSK